MEIANKVRTKIDNIISQVAKEGGEEQKFIFNFMKPLTSQIFDKVLEQPPFKEDPLDYGAFEVEEWEEDDEFYVGMKTIDEGAETGIQRQVNEDGDIATSSVKNGRNHGLAVEIWSEKIVVAVYSEGEKIFSLMFKPDGKQLERRGSRKDETTSEHYAWMNPTMFLKT